VAPLRLGEEALSVLESGGGTVVHLLGAPWTTGHDASDAARREIASEGRPLVDVYK